MDPNELLKQLREAFAAVEASEYAHMEDESKPLDHEAAHRGLSLAADLDQWLSRGGFLPTEWAAGR